MSTDEGNFASMMDGVARQLLGEPNAQLSKPGVGKLRYGSCGSLEVNTIKGTWYDHEVGEGGGVVDLVARQERCDRNTAKTWLKNFHNGSNGAGSINGSDGIEATYDYVDETGKLLFQVCRMAPGAKSRFLQRRPDGHDGWTWKLGGVRRVPFRLPQLLEAVERGMTILVPEGEKDALTLMRLGFAATCNPGGANKWRPEYSEHFRGADVVLVPDNDEPGWKHVNAIGEALTGIARSIRVLIVPGHKDVSDLVAAGGTREQLDKLVEDAAMWVSPVDALLSSTGEGLADSETKAAATEAEDELLAALARMRPGIDRSRKKKRLAKQLGVNQSAIDEELQARWPNGGRIETAPLYGRWVVDPWPEVVDGDALLRDIILRIRRHVVISHEDALAIALWICLAWVHDEVATHSPILAIVSAEPDSGKTTRLGVIAFLIPRSIATVEISEAALYRSIEIWHPSFCIDEFDTVLVSDDAKPLRSVINSGHTKSQGVLRCNTDNTGDKTPKQFSTFGPKAIGMIGRKMPVATLTRCIFVEMRRKKLGEAVERFQHEDDPDLAQLRSRLLRWSADNADELRGAEPAMPGELFNRRGDNWRLQLAIADLAGGDWGDQARMTALRLEGKADKDTIGIKLLADIRRLFRDRGDPDCMLSAIIVAELVQDPEGLWVEYSRGKPLTQNKMAKLLGNFGCIRKKSTLPASRTGRGTGGSGWRNNGRATCRMTPTQAKRG